MRREGAGGTQGGRRQVYLRTEGGRGDSRREVGDSRRKAAGVLEEGGGQGGLKEGGGEDSMREAAGVLEEGGAVGTQ